MDRLSQELLGAAQQLALTLMSVKEQGHPAEPLIS